VERNKKTRYREWCQVIGDVQNEQYGTILYLGQEARILERHTGRRFYPGFLPG
jgi:hypothetical protein